jgi:predicted ATPase/DNA-binding CsgD family transcriptional regulator/DNA-binding XRE family transcriptional regulator
MTPVELRAERRALGLTQAELARELGVATNTVARWERAEMPIGNPELVQLALQRLRRLLPDNQEAPLSNLPAELSSFIGREREVAELRMLLERTRALTLTGMGGVGKTRLARRVAADVLARYADGVWLVELGPLRDPALVLHEVAATLGIHQRSRQSLRGTLEAALHPRELLLVLDNCEHLIAACAELVDLVLRAGARLQVLATSREPLGVAGETVWRVPPLTVPSPGRSDSVRDVTDSEAGRLFVERARGAVSRFPLDAPSARSIAQICQQLDGMPLALELAAAQVDVLHVDQIANRLGERLRLLVGSGRGAPPRQQSLRAAVAWSHDLLGRQEQVLFRRVAAFASGWTLHAAECVCADVHLPTQDVLNALGGLSRKSLVVTEQLAGESRFRFLETVRAFAWEQLQGSGEDETIRSRHAAYYLDVAEAAEPHLRGPQRRAFLERLEREQDNLRAALTWSQAAGEAETALRLAGALAWFWHFQGNLAEGRRWLGQVLATQSDGANAPEHVRWLARAHAAGGQLAHLQGDVAEAKPLLQAAAEYWRSLGDARGLAYVLVDLGQVAMLEGDLAAATMHATSSVDLFRQTSDRWGLALALQDLAAVVLSTPTTTGQQLAQALYEEELLIYSELGDAWGRGLPLLGLGRVAVGLGEFVRARALLEESRAIFQAAGDRRLLGFVLNRLGELARLQHDWPRVVTLYRENLTIWRDLAQPLGMAASLEGLAVARMASDSAAPAARLFGAAAGLREESGSTQGWQTDDLAGRNAALANARLQLGDAWFAAAWAEGHGHPLELVDAAINEDWLPPHVAHIGASKVDRITPREREIATLVARGYVTRDIAQQLVVSERTVDNHLQHILSKLHLHSRTQIAAWMIQQGMYDTSRT